jgi:hypothetical protein
MLIKIKVYNFKIQVFSVLFRYFYCLFQILWKIVKENRKLLLQKMKITSDVFFDGVFMLEIEAKDMIKNEN